MSTKQLIIHGLRENNLKNIDLSLPHDQFITLTGLSGSGKSSLAFDTVYAEGQRRYIETFSPYTRQFLDKLKKPEADNIQHVRPAIAIQQRTRIANSRSTVGSLTDINDYLKNLWCQLASPHCNECGQELKGWSASDLSIEAEKICKQSIQATYYLGCLIKWPKTLKARRQLVDNLMSQGFIRYYDPISSSTVLLEQDQNPPLLSEVINISILILERFAVNNFNKQQLIDAINTAYSVGQGACLIFNPKLLKTFTPEDLFASQYHNRPTCSRHGSEIPRLVPAMFSYNHPLGACPDCKGFGYTLTVDRNLCVPNPALSISEHALVCWSSENRSYEHNRLLKYCHSNSIPVDQAWFKLTKSQQDLIFEHKSKDYIGVQAWFKRLERKAYKMHIRVLLSRYRSQEVCSTCSGTRLKPAALAYRFNNTVLPELWTKELYDLKDWLVAANNTCPQQTAKTEIFNDLFQNVTSRIDFLIDLGLGYLTLDRQARTLSNGETQRVNLATALGSNLTATHFVLDEPSVGLHARDTDRLIQSIRKLKKRGNSLLVVEHDPEFISSSEAVIEIGPAAGTNGGELIYQGAFEKWPNRTKLIDQTIRTTPKLNLKNSLKITAATARNLKNISTNIPLNCLCVISGVSGSGKSSLISEVLLPAFKNWKNGLNQSENKHGLVAGFDQINDCLLIDQSPLVKNPRANVATYSGLWDIFRQLLASSDQARIKGFSPSYFSFNSDGGRCPACKGAGHIKEDMQFLSDVFMPCEVCLGDRFLPVILDIKLQGKNAIDLLRSTVSEIKEVFASDLSITKICELLELLGLGYLRLGHTLSELSGGEAQRLKLASHITEPSQSKTHLKNNLFVFDEPSSGLHVKDIERLIKLFDNLIQAGNSVLCIEHNLQIIANADWIIDLGPEAGKNGGELIFEGSYEQLKALAPSKSHTASYLQKNHIKSTQQTKEDKIISKKSFANLANATNNIIVRGAKEHNLKNFNIDIPLEKTIAFVGVSGSGKTSLAKDILFAEGQRRYLDCLSPYARQFIKGLKKPDLDQLENVPPSIYIGQHTHLPSRLSTVGTLSEIYNYLRLLYSKLGQQHCPDHPEQVIASLTAKDITENIKTTLKGSIKLLAPIVIKKKGSHREVIERAINSEISEVRVDQVIYKTSQLIEGLERNKVHSIEYVIATCNLNTIPMDLLQEAIDQAFALSNGIIIILNNKSEYLYSTARACPECQKGFYKLAPEDFSFSSKRGWCSKCEGSGINQKNEVCTVCNGTKLNKIASSVKLNDKNIHDLCLLSLDELSDFLLAQINKNIRSTTISGVFHEIQARINTLKELGLDYLKLNQDCRTLSAGELQRLRLAAAIGSPLSGVLYLLDEPSASLHPLDNQLVLKQIDRIKNNGNTVAIVEHDPDTILAAEHIIELGPAGGKAGGQLIFNGPKQNFLKSKTITAKTILANLPNTNLAQVPSPVLGHLVIESAKANNVAIKKLKIPLGQLVVVAGVSGAGKSSLVHSIIHNTLVASTVAKDLKYFQSDTAKMSSSIPISRTVLIDQAPLGKNSRSTPAVFLKIWDQLRSVLAQTHLARASGWNSSFFSFNSGKGRCPDCQGRGEIILEMNFLANASITCETCLGKRFSEAADSVKYADLAPSQILNLTFEEAATIFNNHSKIRRSIKRACEVGLGYLTLGQNSATLSGGEAQRLKIVKELSTNSSGHKIYIFDEPTTGLHETDVSNLLKILRQLVEAGNSVVVIEHNRSVVAAANHVIELGPAAGPNGGQVIFQGKIENLQQAATPWGQQLKPALALKGGQHS